MKDNSTLQKNIAQAKSVLEEARYESISGKSNFSYGVKVQSSSLILFRGSYNATDTQNKIYNFEGATADTISLNGGGTQILFNKNSGITSNSGTFIVRMTSNTAKIGTVSVTQSGLISEE